MIPSRALTEETKAPAAPEISSGHVDQFRNAKPLKSLHGRSGAESSSGPLRATTAVTLCLRSRSGMRSIVTKV
jgi:hypothetical protein